MVVNKKRRSSQAAVVSTEDGSTTPTPSAAIMLNHIPEGFFENAICDYFTQFGTVRRVRVARSKKTGNFKGYAFVLYTDVDVAQIAAEAMDGYLMFEKRITCKRLTTDRLPKCLKHGPVILQHLPSKHGAADKHARSLNRKRSHRVEHELNEALVKRLKANNAKLTKLGVDYQFNPPTIQPLESLKHGRKSKEVIKVDEKDVKNDEEVKVKDEVPSPDGSDSDGDTTFDPDVSMFSMLDDSSDDEIVFKTPPNTIRKSKRSRDQTLSTEDLPTKSPSTRKSIEKSPNVKTTKQATPKSSGKKQKNETTSKIPTLKSKESLLKKMKKADRSVGVK